MAVRDLTEQLARTAGFDVPVAVHVEAEALERDLAAIADNRDLSSEAKQRKIAERRERAVATIERLSEESVKAATRDLDQAEGRIRASLRFDVPSLPEYASPTDKIMHAGVVRAAEAERRAVCQDLIAGIRTAEAPDDIIETAEDVAAYGSPALKGRALREARIRLDGLAKRAAPHLKPALQAAASRMANAEAEHRKAHPGSSRALKQIDRERSARQQMVATFYGNYLPRALGLAK